MEIKEKFLSAISDAKNIVISTHSFPDADGIGSEISLCLALRSIGKNVVCCNDKKLLERYKYLDPFDVVQYVENLDESFKESPDLIIVVDTNTILRTGKQFVNYYEKYKCKLLFIDHHPYLEDLGDLHCIDTTAAATGQLVGELILDALELPFTPETALPLYTAILIDTSSFRYPTVTAKTHEIVAKLMATGIEPPSAYNGIYGTKKIEHMHLLGKVLSTTNTNSTEDIAWIVLKKDELAKYNVDIEDTHAFINHLLVLDKIKVSCMFRDDGDQVKISLRSSGKYDVGHIAMALGGGGHSHSAATIVPKTQTDTLESIVKSVIAKIEKELIS